MLKILHATAKLTPSRGQLAQLQSEYSSARRLGLQWDTLVFCPEGRVERTPIIKYVEKLTDKDCQSPLKKAVSWPKLRRYFYSWLMQHQDEYDVLLLRYNFHDPYQLSFIRRVSTPVYLVHHTFEVQEMRSTGSLLGKLRGYADAVIAPPTLRAATGVIGVTEEIAQYELGRAHAERYSAIYPNGLDTTDTKIIEDKRSGPANLLFVAGSFAPWHGLDLLLEKLRESDINLTLHLIGEVSAKDRLAAKADTRVRLYGSMPRHEIPMIARECDIGLSSFAMYRNGMTQGSSLKVREYLSLGLPVYAGYKDIFPCDFLYFKEGSVCIQSIESYAMSMRKIKRECVAKAAYFFIDKGVIMGKLMGDIESHIGKI